MICCFGKVGPGLPILEPRKTKERIISISGRTHHHNQCQKKSRFVGPNPPHIPGKNTTTRIASLRAAPRDARMPAWTRRRAHACDRDRDALLRCRSALLAPHPRDPVVPSQQVTRDTAMVGARRVQSPAEVRYDNNPDKAGICRPHWTDLVGHISATRSPNGPLHTDRGRTL